MRMKVLCDADILLHNIRDKKSENERQVITAVAI
jgi:hypothetical protein